MKTTLPILHYPSKPTEHTGRAKSSITNFVEEVTKERYGYLLIDSPPDEPKVVVEKNYDMSGIKLGK